MGARSVTGGGADRKATGLWGWRGLLPLARRNPTSAAPVVNVAQQPRTCGTAMRGCSRCHRKPLTPQDVEPDRSLGSSMAVWPAPDRPFARTHLRCARLDIMDFDQRALCRSNCSRADGHPGVVRAGGPRNLNLGGPVRHRGRSAIAQKRGGSVPTPAALVSTDCDVRMDTTLRYMVLL